jgi:hypothetical protein
MTLHLLKVHLQTFLSIPVPQKCQILSCATLVANERYVQLCLRVVFIIWKQQMQYFDQFEMEFLHHHKCHVRRHTVIPWLTKIIRSGITFVSRNVISHRLSGISLLAVSNVNNPVRLVGLLCVMWSAHFFVTHIRTEKISSLNGPTIHVCCFMLVRASTKTFVRRIHIR